jgi:hypothetical protein
LRSGVIYYNSILDVVENGEGYVLKNVKPPLDMVNEYWLKYDKLKPPVSGIRSSDNNECIKSNKLIIYDRLNNRYVHSVTGKQLYGYKIL